MSIRKLASVLLAIALLLPGMTASAGTFTPGEYAGSAQGFGGAVDVRLTVDEEAITAITITGANETEAIGGAAIATLISQALSVVLCVLYIKEKTSFLIPGKEDFHWDNTPLSPRH